MATKEVWRDRQVQFSAASVNERNQLLRDALIAGVEEHVAFYLHCANPPQVSAERALEGPLHLDFGRDIRDVTGTTLLDVAAREGNVQSLARLLSEGSDSALGEQSKRSALFEAIWSGQLEAVSTLLDARVDATSSDTPGMSGMTPLGYAAQDGHTEIARLLISSGVPVDGLDPNGQAALFYAAGEGYVETVRCLLDCRANVHACGSTGWTALHNAADNGRDDVVSLLISGGSPVNQPNQSRHTALFLAAMNGHLKTVQVLLEGRADVNATDAKEMTALQSAAYGGHAEIVAALIAAESPIEHADRDENRALHHAASQGHLTVVQLLLLNHAEATASNIFGWTALHAAADQGYANLVGPLIEAGIPIDGLDKEGNSPLFLAALTGRGAMVDSLCNLHCDVSARTQWGATALHLVADASQDQTRHPDTPARGKAIQRLLEAGIPVDDVDSGENTALHYAAEFGMPNVAARLIAAGANVNALNRDGETPLLQAAIQNNVDVAEALCNAGANVEIAPVLHRSAFHGNREIVGLLLKRGVDVNRLDDNYGSALCSAIYGTPYHTDLDSEIPENRANAMNQVDVIQDLCKAGADPRLHKPGALDAIKLAKSRLSPSTLALVEMHLARAKFLLEHRLAEQRLSFPPPGERRPGVSDPSRGPDHATT